MNCCVIDLCEKEVINLKDGARLGCVNDVEIDTCSGRVVAIIVKCRSKLLNFGNKQDDIKICWEQTEVIGDETILVNIDCVPGCCKAQKSSGFINNLFREG